MARSQCRETGSHAGSGCARWRPGDSATQPMRPVGLLPGCRHVLHQLPRQLRQQLLRYVRHLRDTGYKLHKLHDVAHCLAAVLCSQPVLVRVEHAHGAEVRALADAHQHDAQRGVRRLHHRLYGLLHVHDAAVSQDEQAVVRLLFSLLAGDARRLGYDLVEEGGPRQPVPPQRLLVRRVDALHACDMLPSRQLEAVLDLLVGQRAPKAPRREAAVVVVELQHLPHRGDGLLVRVEEAGAQVVQRARLVRLAVRGGEVYRHHEAYPAAGLHIVQEGVPRRHVHAVHLDLPALPRWLPWLGRHGEAQRLAASLELRQALHAGLDRADEVVPAVALPVEHLQQQRALVL
mmetsp:Transcript_5871/g.15326  ORF Transcript_5871/g.15326 Transcript_5871/m.15326 type:complete len:346 (-) Transcript_5871:280-1317(-)